MASDRARRICQQVAEVLSAPPLDYDPESPLTVALCSATIPEIFAVLIAQCRSEGKDETENVETLIRALPNVSREELLEWNATLQPLGYGKVSSLLRRMARHARSSPPTTVMDRIKARQAALSAGSNRVHETEPAKKLVQ